MNPAVDMLTHATKGIAARKELAELEFDLKLLKAEFTLKAQGSNKEAREAWAAEQLEGKALPVLIREKRAEAESWEAVVEAIKAQIRIDLVVALGGNLTDDQAIHRHIERMGEDPRVASILDDEEVLGNEHEGLR